MTPYYDCKSYENFLKKIISQIDIFVKYYVNVSTIPFRKFLS